MSMPQVSNVVDFELAQLMRADSQAKTAAIKSPASYTEVSQLISGQLQTTLDIAEIMEIFFQSSQYLVRYDAVHYLHTAQSVNVKIGAADALYAVNYRLTFQGEYLGDLFLQRSKRFHEQELISFESLTTSLIFPLRNGLKYHAAVQSALLDPLTGVGNRAAMNKTLQRDMDAARRAMQPLSIIMLDIDYFKNINDTYGHACGDQVLIEISKLLQLQLRTSDAIFRFGGEEFLITLPNTCSDYAQLVGERIRHAIEKLVIDFNDQSVMLSASLGCATMHDAEEQDSFIQRSDYALYTAKRSGRNCLKIAG
ncbi:MAG: GGDEF domain-containing protein [Thiopseudomonas sp.]|nr:GGDEF domain-containing protein [Thiopseudomonas sp.]MCK9464850.1 GGDEF domain-containing protein [Thiopseudomonas sp.]